MSTETTAVKMGIENITTKVEDGMLIIAIDMKKKLRPTKGGKGNVIASTNGFRNVPGMPVAGFNIMVYERGGV